MPSAGSIVNNRSFNSNRLESKFLIHKSVLPSLSEILKPSFQIFENQNSNELVYQTIYFDTENLDMFRHHVAGKLPRTKIRIRKYMNSQDTFLEIKEKDNRSHIQKYRQQISDYEIIDSKFIQNHSSFSMQALRNKIQIDYHRIAFISSYYSCRLNLDFEIQYNDFHENSFRFNNLIILEIKYTNYSDAKILFNELKKLGIRPSNFSKYCFGLFALNQKVHSRYKRTWSQILHIENEFSASRNTAIES